MHPAWTRIELVETPSLLERLYRGRHNSSLKKAKAQEIVANVIQARQYFESSENTDYSVRPLLIYYGVLALSRALILFMRHEYRECSLNPAHGLSIINEDKSNEEGYWPFGLRARVTKGTFMDLVESTASMANTVELDRDTQTLLKRNIAFADVGMIEGEICFEDVLRRYTQASLLYQEVFEVPPRRFKGLFWQSNLTFDTSGLLNFDEKDFRDAFGITSSTKIRKYGNYVSLDNTSGGLVEECGFKCFEVRGGVNPNLAIPALPSYNGKFLDDFAAYYCIAYFLGMACRYYPSKWLYAIAGGANRAPAYPVLTRLLTEISVSFPRMIVELFEGRLNPPVEKH